MTDDRRAAWWGGGWGFAEATLWFVVPDLLLTFMVLTSRRIALRAAAWATLGALVGGALLFFWGGYAPSSARRCVALVPGISTSMLEQVRGELAADGSTALFRGPLNGVPYKVYAIEAGAAGLPLAMFLSVSVPARLARFVLSMAIVAAIARAATARRVSLRNQRWLLGGFWLLFYVWYWTRVGW